MGKTSVYDRGPESCQRRLAVDTVVLDAVPSVSKGARDKSEGVHGGGFT